MNTAHLTENCGRRRLHVVVDAYDIVQTLSSRMRNHVPHERRVEYCQIGTKARWNTGDKIEREPVLEYFGTQIVGGHFKLHDTLKKKKYGFYLHLTPRSESRTHVFHHHKSSVVNQLNEILSHGCECPTLFVAGGCRNDRVCRNLVYFYHRQELHLLSFTRLIEFEPEELEGFASTPDLVEWRLADRAVYRGIPKRELARVRRRLQGAPEPSLSMPGLDRAARP